MYDLIFTEAFDKSFSKIKNKVIKNQIWKKILELENKAPLGKKLKNNPFWSIHINKYRLIYGLKSKQIIIIELLSRKKEYREL